MIQFTNQCAGDLGISVNGRVVAMAYYLDWRDHPRPDPFTVYDLIAGGEPVLHTLSIAEVCNKLLALAQVAGTQDAGTRA